MSILGYRGAMRDHEDDGPLTRGHKKKARTRRLLLDTALEVLATDGDAFTVADLAARAGVSHGTFYNYFADREALIAALVPDLISAFAADAAAEVDDPDPALRFARISARALAHAVEAPDLVRAALRLEGVQQALLADEPFAHLRLDLAEGHRVGRFAEPPDRAALDVVAGSLLAASRRIADEEMDPGYRVAVIGRLLVALGVDSAEAAPLAARAVGSP